VRTLTIVEALREAMREEMIRDENVIIIGEDVGIDRGFGGAFTVTLGLSEQFGHQRVLDTPISEAGYAGLAVGAAIAGMRPIVDLQYADFIYCMMDQLVNEAAKLCYMSGGQVHVPIVVRAPVGATTRGAQHSQMPEAMFMHVPGLKVVAPSNAYDAKGCLIHAIRDDNPVIFVEHRLLYFTDAYVPEEEFEVPFGKARRCTQGDDITIVGISNMLVEALRASELLAEIGVHAEVIDPISLVPLDIDTIVESVRRTGRLLVVDNAWTSCGASAEIVAGVVERVSNGKPIQVQRMGYAPTTCPTTPVLEREFYPDPSKIAQTAYAMVRPGAKAWQPDAKASELAYQKKFRGPF
jgi:acetoin:2,6-dichlorophenolindophenol oxidoreductase subunit beta